MGSAKSSAASSRQRAFVRRKSRVGALMSRLLLTAPEPFYLRQRPVAVAWNLYRTGGATSEPERWWHQLGWKLSNGRYDPFGRSARGRRPW